MLKYSDTSQPILSAIRDRVHLFTIPDLLLLCVMFDPSQDFTRHLVYQSQKLRYLPAKGLQHSASMDSLNQFAAGWTVTSVSDSTYSPVHTGFEFDLADGGDCQGEVHPQVYYEMFIESLLWLNQKRSQTQVSQDTQYGVCNMYGGLSFLENNSVIFIHPTILFSYINNDFTSHTYIYDCIILQMYFISYYLGSYPITYSQRTLYPERQQTPIRMYTID